VEALRDYQKAIELNDNRAVYRSKLNLDSDEAARQSALARVYSDLGFQQLALVEGWKSVNTDPTNHSAHRFLADSYSARPRHEIARVSELLQSQLLQPTNITPIQPRLAESNLFLISAQGPGSLSFNEFNPIFNRNGVTAQFSTLAGEHDTIGGELVLAAIQNKLSWSLGYSLFDTDGWRDNADQNDKIANAFVQYELTYKTSIQAEFRYRETENGDLNQRFFEDNFLPSLREEDTTKTIRFGFRHAFSSGSDLLGNFQYGDRDFNQDLEPVPNLVSITNDTDVDNAYGAELQYLFRSQYVNLVTGAGYFYIDSENPFTVNLNLPPPPIGPGPITTEGTQDLDVEHTNAYLYSYIKPLEILAVTVGGSYDNFDPDDEDAFEDKDKLNPKLGVILNPFPSTTLRGAAFRVLKRSLITNQTLEPTQVAGFNQFFDEVDAADYWIYGGAIDQKFTESIYAGLEYTFRDLNVPFTEIDAVTGDADLENANWDEKTFRTYAFWTPHEWLALSAEYVWQRLERDRDFGDGVKTVETNYAPLGIRFFHPTGLSVGLTGTYVDQQGSFTPVVGDPGEFDNGDDNFFLLDAAISYRLPKRYGFFTVGVKNLTDEDFDYFESDFNNPRITPDRFFFARITLAVP
jgi:hypothetical protein